MWFKPERYPNVSVPAEAGDMLISKGQNNFEIHTGSEVTGPTGMKFLPRVGPTGDWNTRDASALCSTPRQFFRPGLVREGVRFIEAGSQAGLQWDRQFEYGLQSAAMVTDGQLIVDFLSPVTHVGFDMFWFNVGVQLASPATVQVFGADDGSLLHTMDVFEPYAPNALFFGFSDNGGIGRVVLFRDENGLPGVSPIIDNLTFGVAPEA